MFEVTVKNEKGEIFTKKFSSPYLAQKFINKVKRSKKLTFISYLSLY